MAGVTTSLLQVASYGAVCAGALAVGGVVAAHWPPSARIQSYILHIAAGLVFAAVGVEVLPEVLDRALPLAVAVGFAAGVALMVTMRNVPQWLGTSSSDESTLVLLGVVAADIFIDGLLIGVSSITEQTQKQLALVVTIALAVELLALGLSVATSARQRGVSRNRVIVMVCAVAFSPLLGSVAGYFLGGSLSAGWIEGVLAFSAAALLYLATEELLKEAHEVRETSLGTALFFAAFLAMLLIEMMYL